MLIFFQDSFEGWDENTFEIIYPVRKHEVRLFLRKSGIYTGPQEGHFALQLVDLMKIESCPEWPAEEMAMMELLPTAPTSDATSWSGRPSC